MTPKSYADAIIKHYAQCWSRPVAQIRWDQGPTDELPEDFRVLVIQRSEDMTAYATQCMSQPEDTQRLELHLLARASDRGQSEIVELMTALAHYHRNEEPLGLGHSVNFGKPWLQGSLCTYGVISLPYLDGPRLEWLADPPVRFLWLIPVTEDEVQFKKTRGMDALEALFEEKQFDYLDPLRPSVV